MAQITRETYDGKGNLLETEILEVPDNFGLRAKNILTTTVAMTAQRCFIAGIDFPMDWRAYALALRQCVDTDTGPLPKQPDYPVGS